MTRAEQQALKNHTFIGFSFYEIERLKEEFLAGYNQAQQDLMEKFKMWVAYNGYTAKDAEAVYNDFKQFITEN